MSQSLTDNPVIQEPWILEVVTPGEPLAFIRDDASVEVTVVSSALTVEQNSWVFEVATPGPQGRPGLAGGEQPANKWLTYDAQGRVSRVDIYNDAARSQLAGSRVPVYAGQVMTAVRMLGANGVLIRTLDLTWATGRLMGVSESLG